MKTPTAQPQTPAPPAPHAPPQTPPGNGANPAAIVKTNVAAQTCMTILLDDVPKPKDEFSNQELNLFGPHQTVARVIADMIQAPEPKGISIGLEGSWGSGKTTVVKLLGQALKDAENITLIQFDAWAHEGDSLRRTFLEKMIKHLQKLKWVDKDKEAVKDKYKWEENLEQIANRKDVTVTRDFPKLTNWGKAVGLLLLLIPIGGALFGAALKEPFTFTNTGAIAWRFIFFLVAGILCSFAPLLLLVTKQGRASGSGVFELVMNKGATEKRVETDKTPSTTSIEFEKYFKELMTDALSDESRRLILVLDNLDRVDSKDALSIWSTLQTFMQHKQDDDSPWYNRLWTLVLYDPKALSLLWQEKDQEGADASVSPQNNQAVALTPLQTGAEQPVAGAIPPPEQIPQPAMEARNGGSVIATSFIDKSFQIRFEVSPPIPSNWRSFLLGRLAEAFPGHSGGDYSEFHAVYRVLSIDRVMTRQSSPTIRELKLYVNQIGALHRQLVLRGKCHGTGKSDFPLSLLAYYVLLRRRRPNVDVAGGVLRADLPEADFEGLLGEEVGDKLAALHYNVEVSLARQVILEPSIKFALQEGRKEELISYAVNPAAFWQALGEIFDREWLATESVSISKAATCLDDANLLRDADPSLSRPVITKLRDTARMATSWLPLDDVRVGGLTSLFSIVKDREFAADLLKRIVADMVEHGSLGKSLDINIQGWVEKLKPVLLKAGELGWPELYEQQVVEPLSEKLKSSTEMPDEQLVRLLEILFELGRVELGRADTEAVRPGQTAAQALSELIKAGDIARQLKSSEPRSERTLAWAMFLLVREDPIAALPLLLLSNISQADPAPSPGATQNPEITSSGIIPNLANNILSGSELIPHLSSILSRYGEWELLFKMLEADAAYQPLVMLTLGQIPGDLYENDDFKLDPALFLNHWRVLQLQLNQSKGSAIPTAFSQLVSLLLNKTPLLDKIMEQGFQPERAELYRVVFNYSADNAQFKDFLRDGLQRLEREVWEAQFRGEGELLSLVSPLSIAGVEFGDDVNGYEEALAEYAEAILNDRVRHTHAWDNLWRILNPERSRSRFRNHLHQLLINHVAATGGEVPPVFFYLFGDELLAVEPTGNTFWALRSMLPTLINKREPQGLQWVATMLEAHPQVFSKTETRADFREIKKLLLDALLNETDKALAENLTRIANALQLFSADEIVGLYQPLIERYVKTEAYQSGPTLKALANIDIYFILPSDGTPETNEITRKLARIGSLKPPERERALLKSKLDKVLQS